MEAAVAARQVAEFPAGGVTWTPGRSHPQISECCQRTGPKLGGIGKTPGSSIGMWGRYPPAKGRAVRKPICSRKQGEVTSSLRGQREGETLAFDIDRWTGGFGTTEMAARRHETAGRSCGLRPACRDASFLGALVWCLANADQHLGRASSRHLRDQHHTNFLILLVSFRTANTEESPRQCRGYFRFGRTLAKLRS
jgi:hypothetical protein